MQAKTISAALTVGETPPTVPQRERVPHTMQRDSKRELMVLTPSPLVSLRAIAKGRNHMQRDLMQSPSAHSLVLGTMQRPQAQTFMRRGLAPLLPVEVQKALVHTRISLCQDRTTQRVRAPRTRRRGSARGIGTRNGRVRAAVKGACAVSLTNAKTF